MFAHIFVTSVAILAFSSAGWAGPSCAARNRHLSNCVALCSNKWGWPGIITGNSPWGPVVKPGSSADSLQAQVDACGNPNGGTRVLPLPIDPTRVATVSSLTAPASRTDSTSATISKTSTTSTSSTTSHSSSMAGHTTSTASTTSSTSTSPAPSPTQDLFVLNVTPETPEVSHPRPVLASQPSPAPSVPQDSSAAPITVLVSQNDIDTFVDLHNQARSQHGAASLVWDNALASAAGKWASVCTFEHSGGKVGPFGENLAAGTGGDFGAAASVKAWVAEAPQYDPNNPVPSHFTQVVWKGSKKVGCAVKQCNLKVFGGKLSNYIVCEYSPPGNVIGQFGANVQP